MCSTERGEISVAVRTGERHEVNEKVCMRKAGMPNPERNSDVVRNHLRRKFG